MTQKPINDTIVLQEMMTHPALFFHPAPKIIAIHGDHDQKLLQEVLKHTTVTQICHDKKHADPRVNPFSQKKKTLFDIIILAEKSDTESFASHLSLLNPNGLLVQQSTSLLEIDSLKSLQQQLINSGFSDVLPLTFLWKTVVVAFKESHFKRIREKDIFNRPFKTLYYNIDTHKAAMALPEFARHLLTIEEVTHS
ncbi:hypothetical protein AYO45_03840 [Gammaproteobacteria bacterium SCGC AG-212-F23]|nr:hypothetical protein AYO45_03840 [Gammaproteobacteria bacterium SCGC AG-212-F23]